MANPMNSTMLQNIDYTNDNNSKLIQETLQNAEASKMMNIPTNTIPANILMQQSQQPMQMPKPPQMPPHPQIPNIQPRLPMTQSGLPMPQQQQQMQLPPPPLPNKPLNEPQQCNIEPVEMADGEINIKPPMPKRNKIGSDSPTSSNISKFSPQSLLSSSFMKKAALLVILCFIFQLSFTRNLVQNLVSKAISSNNDIIVALILGALNAISYKVIEMMM